MGEMATSDESGQRLGKNDRLALTRREYGYNPKAQE